MVAGFALPAAGGLASGVLMPNLRYLVMSLLFLALLRVDIVDVLRHLANARFLVYGAAVFLVVSPAVLYAIALPLGRAISLAVLILSATPVGAVSVTLADLVGGNAALAAGMAVLSSLLAPFTVPLVLGLASGSAVDLDRWSLFASLALTLFVPMLCSQVVVRWLRPVADYLRPRASVLNVLTLFLICFAPLAAHRELLLERPARLAGQAAVVFATFGLLLVIGYFTAPHRSREDRLALAAARAYMNLALAILIAATYFGPEVRAAVVVTALPWSTLLKPLEIVARRL